MAPEAFVPETKLNGSADVYSLACVCYWMLAKKILFESSSPISYFTEHMKTEPPPIRDFSGISSIPGELEDLLLECLSKDATERITSKELLKKLLELEQKYPWTYAMARDGWTENIPDQ